MTDQSSFQEYSFHNCQTSALGLHLIQYDMAIDGQLLALMCCQYLFTLSPDDLDRINEKPQIYKAAEQYANTGFKYIEAARRQSDEENYLYDELAKLDEMYESIMAT